MYPPWLLVSNWGFNVCSSGAECFSGKFMSWIEYVKEDVYIRPWLHHLVFLASLLRMGGYRILPRVRPQIIYLGRTSQIPCDKKSSYSILLTLVSLGSKGVYIGALPTRMYPSSIPLGSTLSTFEMASRVKRHDSHATSYFITFVVITTRRVQSYTPPCPDG